MGHSFKPCSLLGTGEIAFHFSMSKVNKDYLSKKKIYTEARELYQSFKVPAALAEDTGSVLRICIMAHNYS